MIILWQIGISTFHNTQVVLFKIVNKRPFENFLAFLLLGCALHVQRVANVRWSLNKIDFFVENAAVCSFFLGNDFYCRGQGFPGSDCVVHEVDLFVILWQLQNQANWILLRPLEVDWLVFMNALSLCAM